MVEPNKEVSEASRAQRVQDFNWGQTIENLDLEISNLPLKRV